MVDLSRKCKAEVAAAEEAALERSRSAAAKYKVELDQLQAQNQELAASVQLALKAKRAAEDEADRARRGPDEEHQGLKSLCDHLRSQLQSIQRGSDQYVALVFFWPGLVLG
jgi:hypothetical protein